MKLSLSKLLGRLGDFSDLQPLPSLFIGAALFTVFLAITLRLARKAETSNTPSGLLWRLYLNLKNLLWAASLTSCLVIALSSLRSYLHGTVSHFQRSHGRVTEANFNAVQTIWGAEQTQMDLGLEIYYDEEVTERIDYEDPLKPSIIRKKTQKHAITSNPFVSARHSVVLKQNARKKGSALYGGYETDCHFSWRFKNPESRELKSDIRFPLPADGAMYNDLTATLNGKDILDKFEIKEGALCLPHPLKPDEVFDLKISFKSRGMSYWYFQVREPREIRDFALTLTLPDVAKSKLNNPEGCMSPTDTKPTADGKGSVLSYRLDHAISNKGMGVALPNPPQPGESTKAVLGATEQGWLLLFAMLLIGLTAKGIRNGELISLFFGAATALGYGLLGDFSDLLLGFWGTAVLLLLPGFILLALLLNRVVQGRDGKFMAAQFLAYGLLLPCLAGLDEERETLYLNLSCVLLLTFVAGQLLRKEPSEETPLKSVPA